MGKWSICVLATLFAVSLSVDAQSGKSSRPRVVESPTIKNDEPVTPGATRPPVLSETVVKPKEQLKSAPKPPAKAEE